MIQLLEDIFELTKESSILRMSEDRHNKIIKVMYGKINIREHVQKLDYLTNDQQDKYDHQQTSKKLLQPSFLPGVLGKQQCRIRFQSRAPPFPPTLPWQ